MKEKTIVLAFDLGASSGRAIKAEYNGESLSFCEIHRFENSPRVSDGHLRWDFSALLSEIKTGIKKAGNFESAAFDTWGVDFGLLDKDGKLLETPVHYRDARTEGMVEEAAKIMPLAELYRATGTQIMPINTLFQLLAVKKYRPELFKKAETLLFMPDLFAYAISGSMVCEKTIASTAQLLKLPEGVWDKRIIKKFGIPEKLFLPPTASGTVIGTLPENGAKIIAAAGHDTQCAAAAVPLSGENTVFLSCGTWSLLGCELSEPILTEESLKLGFSNELGANGKVNCLKNIIGLWLIQESRRQWQKEGYEYSFADLEASALESPPLRCFIDPDDPVFVSPGNMPERIRAYCARTGQAVPKSAGEITRCIYESLALKYRFAVERLEKLTGRKFSAVHILGGGSKAALLCRMTASASQKKVIAGPAEATALGNIIIQLKALGKLNSIDEGRKLIAQTEKLTEYLPTHTEEWQSAYNRYKVMLENT